MSKKLIEKRTKRDSRKQKAKSYYTVDEYPNKDLFDSKNPNGTHRAINIKKSKDSKPVVSIITSLVDDKGNLIPNKARKNKKGFTEELSGKDYRTKRRSTYSIELTKVKDDKNKSPRGKINPKSIFGINKKIFNNEEHKKISKKNRKM